MWPFTRKPKDADRQLFRFWDGERQRSADPFAALLAFDDHPEFDIAQHAPALDRGDKDAMRLAIDATRQVFQVKEWREDQPGLTQAETLALFWQFMAYNQAVKKN